MISTMRSLIVGALLGLLTTSVMTASVPDDWEPVGFAGMEVAAVAIDPLFSSTLYAAASGTIFKSTSGGADWVDVGASVPAFQTITKLEATTTAVFALTSTELYRSLDGGSTWGVHTVSGGFVKDFALSHSEPGTTWMSRSPFTFGDAITCVVYQVAPCRTILQRTNASGENATLPARALNFVPFTLAASSQGVWAGAAGSVWNPGTGRETVPGNVTILAATPGAVYAVGFTAGDAHVFRRTDSGVWNEAGAGLPPQVRALIVPLGSTEIVYAGTRDGAYRTADGGASWSRFGLDGLEVVSFAAATSGTETLYAGTSGGLFRRTVGEARPCVPGPTAECLGDGRFRIEVSWRSKDGRSGRAPVERLTRDTVYFWFFGPNNVDLVVKLLDGTSLNGHHWVFAGSLSAVEYEIVVIDSSTGRERRYVNPLGRLSSFADTAAFPEAGSIPSPPERVDSAEPLSSTAYFGASEPCLSGPRALCLNRGRFRVGVSWRTADGREGEGQAAAITAETGDFWFFHEANVELVVKVLDGRSVNGHFWVFSGALSNVAYTITVTDTETGIVKTYENPQGSLASFADTAAF